MKMVIRECPYTLQFALEATGISSQTMRHWRDILPPLKGRSAHRPCFSAGDLLALRVLDLWVHGVGGKIGRLASSAGALFALCSEEVWPRIEKSYLAFDLATDSWGLVEYGTPMCWHDGVLVFPIGRLASDLSVRLIGNREVKQKSLEFPLMPVPTDTTHTRAVVKRGSK